MSGTSMDGLDISYCAYNRNNSSWSYQVFNTQTVSYPGHIYNRLRDSKTLSSEELVQLDKSLAKFFADTVQEFISSNGISKSKIDCIASHGHTVFHQPSKGYTLQIGCGETLAYRTGIKVINNFRQKDVAAGGQGAPLVPVGDKLLFTNVADTFLNIGGFSNACSLNDGVIAFDICPGNLPLNAIASELGSKYDDKGMIAASGTVESNILDALNQIEFYSEKPPKSLGTEWLEEFFIPEISKIQNPRDKMRTVVEHVAIQISDTLENLKANKVLVTGGGAFNDFLISRISALTDAEIIVPEKELIEFKEAIVFGFLGALYLSETPNCLSSVTGAERDVIGGELHTP
jgi:anhydro-N-acetylmuramic acid kinase